MIDYKWMRFAFAGLLICSIFPKPGFAIGENLDSDILPVVINMYAGDTRVLDVRPVERVAVGSGKLLQVEVINDNQLLLIANNVGETVVHLWRKDGTEAWIKININVSDLSRVESDVRMLLKSLPEIEISRTRDHVVISGTGLSNRALAWVGKVQKLYPQVVAFVGGAPLEMRDMVQMDVRIMEIDSSTLSSLGINWQNAIGGPVLGFADDFNTNNLFRIPQEFNGAALPLEIDGSRTFFGITTNLSSIINLLKTEGKAFELATPTLSARSGGTADFLVGGEIPIPVSSALGQTNVLYKEYGIQLHIEPVTDADNNVLATVSAEISQIDPTITVNGFPAFLTRRVESQINVKSGQTIAISGLVDTRASETFDKLPFLGDIPILGALFRSRNFRSGRTELVIFVTPHIINAKSPQNQEMIEKSNAMLEEFKNTLGENLLME